MDAHSDRLADLDVRILRLEPGDIVVFKAQKVLSAAQVERLKIEAEKMLEHAGHIGIKVAVLDENMDIEILRHGDEREKNDG